MPIKTMPLLSAKFELLFSNLAREWNLQTSPLILRGLFAGKSLASVYAAAITSPGNGILKGQYVLKFDELATYDPPEPDEAKRYTNAVAHAPGFAKIHIPKLLQSAREGDNVALLYEIPKSSLSDLASPPSITNVAILAERYGTIAADFLKNFSALKCEPRQSTAKECVLDLVGYRTDRNKAPRLHRLISEESGDGIALLLGGRLLPNPGWFIHQPCLERNHALIQFDGLLHGDLHDGNILVDAVRQHSSEYWLIDFALSFLGPLGYDHSYLEFSHVLRQLSGADPERLLALLDALDSDEQDEKASAVVIADYGLLKCIRAVRGALKDWQTENFPGFREHIEAQVLLTRVGTGLNWANKKLERSDQILGLTYAAWAAHQFLKRFHPDAASEVMAAAGARLRSYSIARAVPISWPNVRAAVDNFLPSAAMYVLVCGPIRSIPDAAAIGHLPWAAVVDLDPESDTAGLESTAGPVIEKLRSLALFGLDSQPVSFARGTAWLMAGGWTSRSEVVADDRYWGRYFSFVIRKPFDDIY